MADARRPNWGGRCTAQFQRFQPYPRFNSAKDTSSSSTSFRSKWKEYQERRAQDQEAEFNTKYSVCTPSSSYHDLKCGHRIQAFYTGAACGSSCQKSKPGYPFVCPDCTIKDVRISMKLQGMSLSNNDNEEMSDDGPTREEKIRSIADKEIKDRYKKGHRTCMMVNKFEDPTMQFFDQFLREEGFGGIDANRAVPPKPNIVGRGIGTQPGPVTATTSATLTPLSTKVSKNDDSNHVPKEVDSKVWQPHHTVKDDEDEGLDSSVVVTKDNKQRKRPRTKRIPASQVQTKAPATTAAQCKATDNLAEILNETRIALKLEDEVTKAVREAMAKCALD